MNVKFNTNSLGLNIQNKNNNKFKQQTFTGNSLKSSADVANEVMKESTLFAPFRKFYGKFTDGIARHFTSKIVNSKPIIGLASKFRGTNDLFKHCMAIESLLTSGLYMQRTLTNDKMDKDRKKTLAVNQGLTFVLSTLGAYTLDNYLKGWWSGLTEKFAGYQLNDSAFVANFHEHINKIKEANNKLIEAAKGTSDKPLLKELTSLEDFVKMHPVYASLGTEEAKALIAKIKGMPLLRQMIVFGFVYRYFVPVAVTKPANILCEKYLAHKKAKDAEKAEIKNKA